MTELEAKKLIIQKEIELIDAVDQARTANELVRATTLDLSALKSKLSAIRKQSELLDLDAKISAATAASGVLDA